MSLPFGPPYPVSPLIRAARHALFWVGFFYGISKQQLYSAMERKWRAEEAIRQEIRRKEMLVVKARIAREEAAAVKLLETGKLFDPPDMQDSGKPPADKKCVP